MFVTDVFSEKDANVIVLRINCPQSLIESSRMVEPFDIEKKRNLLANVRIFDKGEIEIDAIKKSVKEIINENKLPLILAERHVVSLEAVKVLKSKLVVFDAHADLKDLYASGQYKPIDERTNYATWLRRACEILGARNVCLIGVRSCDEDEFKFMNESGMLYFTSEQVKANMRKVKAKLKEFLKSANTYISIDMDVFDPSIAPAVENPEPNGLLYREFIQLIDPLKKIVGMDVVEIRPLLENRVTEFLAVKVIFELLSLIFS